MQYLGDGYQDAGSDDRPPERPGTAEHGDREGLGRDQHSENRLRRDDENDDGIE
ncbi:hypothetical protein D3C87_2084480 [compost metagenome]